MEEWGIEIDHVYLPMNQRDNFFINLDLITDVYRSTSDLLTGCSVN